MKNDKPLTKEEFLEGLSEFYAGQIKPDLKRLDKKIDGVKADVGGLKADVGGLKADVTENSRKIDDLRKDIADTPTRREFEDLSAKVRRYHPVN